MACNIKANNVDLDRIFMSRVSAAGANVNYQSGGVDLAQRFEPYVSGTQAAITNIQSGGNDLRTKFKPMPVLNWSVTAGQVSSNTLEATPGSAILSLETTGNTTVVDIPDSIEDPWCTQATGNGAEFECYWTNGTLNGAGAAWVSTPTENTWLPLNILRQWEWSGNQSGPVRRWVTITLKIRYKADGSYGEISKQVLFETEWLV